MAFSEYPIHVDQLVIGLFVRVEGDRKTLSSALRKGFKITSQAQIDKLRSSGLTHVLCVLNRSDRLPIAVGVEDLRRPATPPLPERKKEREDKTPISKELFGLKRETIENNKRRRQLYAKTEKHYDQTVSQVAVMLRRVSGRSNEAVEGAAAVVDTLVETFLSDKDVFVNLMTNKPNEEKQHLHAFNVTVLSMMLGKELGLNASAMRSLGLGAMFHDVGKGRVPISEMSMGKPTTMKYAVQRYYELHPQMGAKIVTDMPSFPNDAYQILLQHHETMDGKGFPEKLQGKDIHPLARMVAVADTYDNLCNQSDDREALTPHEALRHMFTKLREKLDNKVLAVFIRNLGVYPPGTVVLLSNGAIGMVVSTNVNNSARPSVLIYHPDIPKREALVIDLVLEEDLEIKKTLRPEELSREVFVYLSPSRTINYYAETVGE